MKEVKSFGDLDMDIDAQIDRIPEPTEKVKPTIQKSGSETENPTQNIKENESVKEDNTQQYADRMGNSFDERMHEKNADGKPRIWHGKLKLKKGWQKGYEAIKAEQEEITPETEPEPIEGIEPEDLPQDEMAPDENPTQNNLDETPVALPSHLKDMSNRQLAELITNIYINIGAAKFGMNGNQSNNLMAEPTEIQSLMLGKHTYVLSVLVKLFLFGCVHG